MAFDLSDFLKVKSGATVETSIGQLSIFSMRMGSNTSLLKAMNSTIKDASPADYIKNLIVYVCYPNDKLKEGEYKPDKPVLTLEEVNNISEKEFEEIAKTYVNINDYLFKKHESKKRVNDEGKEVNYSEYTKIEHPKLDEESYIEYLHRLSCFDEKKQQDKRNKMFASMPKLTSFSDSLSSGITKNLMFGESLTQQFETAISIPTLEPDPVLYDFNWAEIERNKEKVRREPFDDLAERLDQLINSSTLSSEFMVKANIIQTEIASEIKAGGDTTDRHSKNNIKLSFVVIFLTVLGLSLSIWSSFSGVSFSKEQQSVLHAYTSDISESLAQSTILNQENSSQSKMILSDILGSLNKLNINLSSSREELHNALSEIKKLKIENNKYSDQIYKLNEEVERLKARPNNTP